MRSLTCPGATASAFTDVTEIPSSTDSSGLAFTGMPLARPISRAELNSVLTRIRHLGDLEENWDSYGAVRVQSDSIHNALAIVSQLANLVDLGKCPPTVDATPGGCVGLCWDIGGWALDLEIDSLGLIHFVYLDHFDDSRDDDGCTQDLSQIVDYLSQ